MTQFNENISVEETEAYKMGELMEESRKEQLREAIEAGDWPADCQYGGELDGFTVTFNRELLRREAGYVRQAFPRHGYRRNRVRLSSDANGKCWTTGNGG